MLSEYASTAAFSERFRPGIFKVPAEYCREFDDTKVQPFTFTPVDWIFWPAKEQIELSNIWLRPSL